MTLTKPPFVVVFPSRKNEGNFCPLPCLLEGSHVLKPHLIEYSIEA